MSRHVELLRDVAREITPDPDREDPPSSGDDAHRRLQELITGMQQEAPRCGLGAATGEFVDHLAGVAERYGRQLFHCYDDPRIPSTTNKLEGFFGASKHHIRRATGEASTSNSVAQNLGADYLEALVFSRKQTRTSVLEALDGLSTGAYTIARNQIEINEQPARMRRSRRRDPEQHLEDLLARWDDGEDSDHASDMILG